GNERVPVDEPADALRDAVGDPRDDHAAIAVADQDDVLEIVLDQIVDDGLDGLGQPGGPGIAWAIAPDGGRERGVTGRLDPGRHGSELRAGVPRAVNEHIRTHHDLLADSMRQPRRANGDRRCRPTSNAPTGSATTPRRDAGVGRLFTRSASRSDQPW